MTFAHLMGIPVEESMLSLAPAGAAIASGVALFARSTLAGITGWLRRHERADTTMHTLRLSRDHRASRLGHPRSPLRTSSERLKAP